MRERVSIEKIPKSEKLTNYLKKVRDVTDHPIEVENIPNDESVGPPFSSRKENNTFIIQVHVTAFRPQEEFFEQGVAHEATHDRLSVEGYERADFLREPEEVERFCVNWLFTMIEDIPVYERLHSAGFPVCDLPSLKATEKFMQLLHQYDPAVPPPMSRSFPQDIRLQRMIRVTRLVLGAEMVRYSSSGDPCLELMTEYLSLHGAKLPEDAKWAKCITEIVRSHGVDTPERFRTTVNLVAQEWKLEDLIQY